MDNTTRRLAEREPESLVVRHPKVTEAAARLGEHPALGLRCGCGRGLGFVALVPLATGVFVVQSPRRVASRKRKGGAGDLSPVDDPSSPFASPEFTLDPWDAELRRGFGSVKSTSRYRGLAFDSAARVTYDCPRCKASTPLRNDTFVAMFLRAVANGEEEIRLGSAPSATPSQATRVEDRGKARAWSSRRPGWRAAKQPGPPRRIQR